MLTGDIDEVLFSVGELHEIQEKVVNCYSDNDRVSVGAVAGLGTTRDVATVSARGHIGLMVHVESTWNLKIHRRIRLRTN